MFFGAGGRFSLIPKPTLENVATALGVEDTRLLGSTRTAKTNRLVYVNTLNEDVGRRNDLVSQFCGHDVFGDAVVMPNGD